MKSFFHSITIYVLQESREREEEDKKNKQSNNFSSFKGKGNGKSQGKKFYCNYCQGNNHTVDRCRIRIKEEREGKSKADRKWLDSPSTRPANSVIILPSAKAGRSNDLQESSFISNQSNVSLCPSVNSKHINADSPSSQPHTYDRPVNNRSHKMSTGANSYKPHNVVEGITIF